MAVRAEGVGGSEVQRSRGRPIQRGVRKALKKELSPKVDSALKYFLFKGSDKGLRPGIILGIGASTHALARPPVEGVA